MDIRKNKFIFIVLMLALAAMAYLFISMKQVTLDKQPGEISSGAAQTADRSGAVDPAKLEAVYIADTGAAFGKFVTIAENYENSLSATTSVMEKIPETETATGSEDISPESEAIAELKIDLMALRVPEQYRDLHFGLVQALNQYRSYLDEGNEADRTDAWSFIDQAESEYPWLSS